MVKYVYSLNDFLDKTIEPELFVKEVKLSSMVAKDSIVGTQIDGDTVTIYFANELSNDDKLLLDNLVASHSILDIAKREKIAKIDARTSELIKTGFYYDGNHFSMSEAAQRNWIGLAAAKANGLLQFPLPVSTVNETVYTIQNSDSCTAFISAFLMYQVDPTKPLAQGRVLKAQVNNCTTIEQLNAIVDTR